MRKLTVSLTGGLGNQLFQYAAGLYLSEGRVLSVTEDFGKPRLGPDGRAEIFSFSLSAEELRFKEDFLSQKFAGYLLRLGVHRKWWEIKPLMRWLASAVGSTYLSLLNRRKIRIQGFSALGHSEEFRMNRRTNLIVGYFQNSVWASDARVKKVLSQLRLRNPSEGFLTLAEKAKIENPLIVHVRLGDYRKEDTFGILPQGYYEKAVSTEFRKGKYKKIWLFSDEPNEALGQIHASFRENVRLIDNGLSPAESLELMRLGHGYVIANSSFSWWGAFLSYNDSAHIIAPEKWFKVLSDPEHLIPEHWQREKSW